MKKCPYCAEEIQDEAIKCRYCKEWLEEPKEEGMGSLSETQEQSIKKISALEEEELELFNRALSKYFEPEELKAVSDEPLIKQVECLTIKLHARHPDALDALCALFKIS